MNSTSVSRINGASLIAGEPTATNRAAFHAINPQNGEQLDPQFFSATAADVDRACRAAADAFAGYSRTSGRERARFLRRIADNLDAASADLVARAQLETALPAARLQGEVLRTSNQMRLFADVIDEGSWVAARIDTPLPDRKPLPRPDLRSMLRPIGPVAVFGASNFPIAFSVAGGDTASALAAGNPVVVKAHPAHPGTSEIAARIIQQSIQDCGLPPGVFSLLFDAGIEAGKALVQHSAIKAAGFTGSHRGGRALMDLAAQRPDPIPCFAEMSSTNPVFILPGALRERGSQIATGLHGSFTLGAGQFCTKPGLVFLPQQEHAEPFLAELRRLAGSSAGFFLLTPGIASSYRRELESRTRRPALQSTVAQPESKNSAATCAAPAALMEVDVDEFRNAPDLAAEIFGPATLIIRYQQREAMLEAARSLEGHLTATVLAQPDELGEYRDLLDILERKVGRVILNGYPTGVEVSHAMVHGGPSPATSDSRFTSVGSRAILRFARPVCWQGFPESALPDELRNANPLGILRMIDGQTTRDPVR